MFDSPQVVHELLVSLFRCHQSKIEWEREVTGVVGRNERRPEKGGARGTRDEGSSRKRDDGSKEGARGTRDDGELEERERDGAVEKVQLSVERRNDTIDEHTHSWQ